MTSSTIRFNVPALALALAVLAAACGGDDGVDPNADGGTHDLAGAHDLSASTDQGAVYDLAGADFAGVSCGASTCGSNQQCCLVPNVDTKTVTGMCVAPGSSCGDGGVPLTCDGPEECSTGMSQCCVSLEIQSISGSAACTSSCPATATTDNGGSLTTRLCHSPADCTNYSGTAPIVGKAAFDKCCTYPGLSFKFCAPGLVTIASNQITCM